MRKSSLVAAVSAVLACSAGSTAFAQEATVTEQRIQVTGSRISRTDVETANPVQTIDRAQIDRSGVTSVAELLNELGISGAALNQLGSAGTSFGAANVNLRNLGANRVLVLVNGRRWVNASGGRGFRDFVDLNSIPLGIVERIEILKDGASAIYGSDAISGVVNIHTRQDYDGGSARVQLGRTAAGGGEQSNVELTFGIVGSRGSIAVNAGFTENDPILVDQRAFSRMPLGALSLQTPQGRYIIPGQGTFTTIDGRQGFVLGDFRPFVNPQDRVSLFTGTYLTQPLERTNLYLQSRFHLTDSVDIVMEGLYNRRRSTQNFSPAVQTITGAQGFVIPVNHIYNPWGQTLAAGWSANQQFVDNGRRENFQNSEVFRFVLGLEGQLQNGWDWDISSMYAKNDAIFTSSGQIDRDRLALGIGDVARCTATPGCVPINIFGGPGSMSPAMLAWLGIPPGKDHNGTRNTQWQANITGDLYELPAGYLAFAAGFEHRSESGFDRPDALISSNATYVSGARTSGPQRQPTTGEFSLNEAYLELNAPLLRGSDMADLLEFSAAIRYSDYSTFGSTTNTKFGLAWKVNDSLMIRATASEGFRSPSILELFAGRRTTNLPATDPCSGNPTPQPPGCAGVPAAYLQSGSAVSATIGSNPLLQPETSDALTLGFVYEPDWLPGFDMVVDWYRIKVDNAITSIGSQRILNDCAFTQLRCNLITRDPTTGEVLNLINAGVNIAQETVSGVDFTFRYRRSTDGYGDFRWTLDGAYLSEFEQRIPNPGANTVAIDRREGTSRFRQSFPEWKWMLTQEWFHGDWSANLRHRYIHNMTEASAINRVGSVTYHDFQLSRRFDAMNTQIAVGVQNLGNKKPPASLVNANINFDISTYDARGRSYYLRAIVNF